jgi:hypothetical protein
MKGDEDRALCNFVLVPSPHHRPADEGDKPDKAYDDILEGGYKIMKEAMGRSYPFAQSVIPHDL